MESINKPELAVLALLVATAFVTGVGSREEDAGHPILASVPAAEDRIAIRNSQDTEGAKTNVGAGIRLIENGSSAFCVEDLDQLITHSATAPSTRPLSAFGIPNKPLTTTEKVYEQIR